MYYRQLLSVLEKAGVPPGRAAADLGVSGMTLRRWRAKPGDAVLPELYRLAFEPTVRRLVGTGRLHPEDPDVVEALRPAGESFQHTLAELGITHEILSEEGAPRAAVVVGLERLGGDARRRRQVLDSAGMLARFRSLGAPWKRRVAELARVIGSARLSRFDKLVAFGALFYLITPFDLIPDAIPAVGLMDDFAILGIAALHYERRFPALFGDRAERGSTRRS